MGESAVRGGLVEGTRELHLRSEWSVLECWRKPRYNLKPVSVRRPGAQTQTGRNSSSVEIGTRVLAERTLWLRFDHVSDENQRPPLRLCQMRCYLATCPTTRRFGAK
ncbi:hypothetical protein RUM43_001431 [Polyplax serrata]|uniref:Uncharacterized protein n=1 Tax=Polyplax serrata TaxID=468196 RepID=A0AAN8SJH5_POLSC